MGPRTFTADTDSIDATDDPGRLGVEEISIELGPRPSSSRPSSRPSSTRRQWVFDVGCAIFAAHILVDSYLQLRPGTSASDHLVSGTVPIAVLAGVATITRRLRPGGFATVAGTLGVAVAFGSAGAPVSGLLGGRLDVAAVTGETSFVAAVALVGVAAHALWSSRRIGGRRISRWGRRLARGILGVGLVVGLAVPIGMGYVVANRTSPVHADSDLGMPHENVSFGTADGLVLTGSYIPSRNGAAVIVFPGRRAGHTRLLAMNGYGVLVFEPRGQAGSEGDPNLLGWSGEPDLDAAIAYLQTRPDVEPDRIGGVGLSVGGELMIQTAAHNLGLSAVVSEGAGTRQIMEDLHMPAPDNVIGIPMGAVATLATAVFSDSLPPPPLTDLVDDIAPRPLLLIWTRNGVGGEYNNPRYNDHAGEPKTIWEIPEASHTHGLDARPEEYAERLIGFLDQALAPSDDA